MIESELATEVTRTPGRRGEFRVVVDGRTVLARKGGLLALLLRRPWPSDETVITAVKGARSASRNQQSARPSA